jgi:hypothetical protein
MEKDQTIHFGDYLDNKEERKKALEILREIVFNLNVDRWNWLLADHPKHLNDREENLKRIDEEIVYRMQDYDVFMYDFEKDWDLNYQDYGLNKIYEK